MKENNNKKKSQTDFKLSYLGRLKKNPRGAYDGKQYLSKLTGVAWVK